MKNFEDGHRGGHLGYRKGMTLAILHLCVTVMLHIKFWLNPTYCWEEMSFEMGRPSWISEQNNFNNSKSLCCSDASHKVLAQSDMVCEEMYFEEFPGYQNGTILAILNLCDASHQVLAQYDLQFGRRCRLMNFKMATAVAILDIRTERF